MIFYVIKKYRKLLSHFFFLAISLVIIVLIYLKIDEFLLKEDVKTSINSLSNHYTSLFHYFEKHYKDEKIPHNGLITFNNPLYLLASNGTVFINHLTVLTKNKKTQSLDENNPSISTIHLMKNPRNVHFSKAYINPDLIAEFMIDVYYGFETKNSCFALFSTSILLEDALKTLQNVTFHKHYENKGLAFKTNVFDKNLNIYIEKDLNWTSLLLLQIMFIVLYIGIFYRKHYQKIKKQYKEIEQIARILEEQLSDKNSIIQFLEMTVHTLLHGSQNEYIFINTLLNEIVNLKEKKLLQKNIFFLVQCPTDLVSVKSNTACWRIFFNALIDIFIEYYPSGSHLSCTILLTQKTNKSQFLQVIFSDDLPFRSQIFEKMQKHLVINVNTTQYSLTSLMNELNIFSDFSFSNDEGNKLIIAVPLSSKSQTENESNVLSFTR